MLTVMLLTMMAGEGDPATFARMLALQLTLGGLAGWVCAKVGIACLNRFDFATEGFDSIFVVGLALLAYALCSGLGGNGYLCVYLAGILMGNAPIRNKRSLVHFFDGVTGLMQIVIFFLLGLLAFPSQLPSVIIPALSIMVFLTLVARPVAVSLLLSSLRVHGGRWFWSARPACAERRRSSSRSWSRSVQGLYPLRCVSRCFLSGAVVDQSAGHAAAVDCAQAGYDRFRSGCIEDV